MAGTKHDLATEARILEAARAVFRAQGYAGARMEEIAARAQINKSMLHYYFRSKEKLFDVIFQSDVAEIAPLLQTVMFSDLPLFEKIRRFAHEYIDVLRRLPYVPGFILHELSRNPTELVRSLQARVGPDLQPFYRQVEAAVARGEIRSIEPDQLLISLTAACVFPFLGKPVVQMALQLDETGFDAFLEARKEHVVELILHSLRPLQP
jgi:TetR/AcrR family transcriptional regulator